MNDISNMNKIRGFTLVELVVSVSVVAILLGVAVPSYQTIVKNNRLTGQINSLQGSLLLARSEAIKRKATVTLCSSGNPDADTPICYPAGSEDWTQGWIVHYGATPTPANVLKRYPGIEGGNTLCGTGAGLSKVKYTSSGEVPAQRGFTLCDDRGAGHAKAVNISAVGYSETSDKKPDGVSDLTCDCS